MVSRIREIRDYWNGRVFPSGDFTVGYSRPKKKTSKQKRWDEFESKIQKRHYYETHDYGGHQIRYIDEWYDSTTEEYQRAYMDLTTPTNSHKSKTIALRGTKGISSYARRMIKSGAQLLQQKYTVRRLALLTLTLPSLPPLATELILSEMGGWSEIVRKSVQELRRELIRKGGKGEIIGCIEIQEKRYKKYKEVAPHLHLIFEAHKGDYKYYLSKEKVNQIWTRIINVQLSKIGFDEGYEFPYSSRIEAIKKGAKEYIGKYMSKGGSIIKEIKEDGKETLLPSSWWVCTKKLKDAIKLNILPLPQYYKDIVFSRDKELQEKIFDYCISIEKKWNEEMFIMGYIGKIKDYKIMSNAGISDI